MTTCFRNHARKGIRLLLPSLALALFSSCGDNETNLAPLPAPSGHIIVGTVKVGHGVDPAGVIVSLEAVEAGLPLSVRQALDAAAVDDDVPAAAATDFDRTTLDPTLAPTLDPAATLRVTTTDASGRFAFSGVDPGEWQLSGTARHHLAGGSRIVLPALTPASAETTIVDIALQPTGTFAGVATLDNATNHRGVVVYVEGLSNVAVTNAAGGYVLRDVPIGLRNVYATKSGWLDATRSGTLNAAGDSVTLSSMALRVENNIPPTVTITTAPARGNVYQATSFVATANDPDGTIVRYEWDWDDNGTFNFTSTMSNAASYTFPSAGNYRTKVRVTDNKGAISLAVANIAIYDAFYVTTTGSDANDGTRTAPFRTITHAMAQHAVDPRLPIRVGLGTYVEALDFLTDVTIVGGYNTTTWTRSPGQRSTVVYDHQPAVADEIVFLSVTGLEILADDAPPGASSVALTVRNCTDELTFFDCRFVAGEGGAGVVGANGAVGAAGNPGFDGENAGFSLTSLTNYPGTGGSGGISGHGGGDGGISGTSGSAGNAISGSGNGTAGSGGPAGINGGNGGNGSSRASALTANGTAPAAGGVVTGLAWLANAGGPGTHGQVGGHGGGGGGGGSGAPFGGGGGGGGGGEGGQGGRRGSGGGGGGGSFGLLVIDTRGGYGQPQFTDCAFAASNAGNGGAGGSGALGGPGAPGGDGGLGYNDTTDGGNGGIGGNGNTGAPGGGGTGGAGGWSYAVYNAGLVPGSFGNCTYSFLSPGVGGAGGFRAGPTPTQAPGGPAGLAGTVYTE